MQKKILIVGYGIFGRLMADILSRDFEIYIHNRSQIKEVSTNFGGKKENIKILLRDENKRIKKESFPDVDFVVFCVPVQFLLDSIKELKKFISRKSIIMDVSSVKVYPLDILKKNFPENEIIGTHPMFGVPSIEKKLDDLKVVLSNVSCSQENVDNIVKYIKNLDFEGINFDVIKMDACEHDKRTAKIQALTHFIGEGLKCFDLVDDELKTYSYRILYNLHVDTALNTRELFETIQKFNPYAKDIRKKLISKLIEIDKDLE